MVADEDPQPAPVRVTRAEPATVLDRNRLIESPALCEGVTLFLRDLGVVVESRRRATRRSQEDGVDQQRSDDEGRDCPDEPSDDEWDHCLSPTRLVDLSRGGKSGREP